MGCAINSSKSGKHLLAAWWQYDATNLLTPSFHCASSLCRTTAIHNTPSGLTKRLPETAVQLISSCNSSALRDLRLEGGRRGIAAVAADHLDHLGFMTQLTSLSLALSKGSLPAGKSAQQLQKLAGVWCVGEAVCQGHVRV